MTINLKNLCVALVLVILAPFQASADEVTDVVNGVAAKLVQQLPMDKKIALKSLSPDETGLPEDFLRKLTSDLEAALLTASDFEINLANRATMEDVWQEAVEFNNADFDELFKNANADVMLMMSPRAISTGVEIAITAYALTGNSVGKTLASSGSVILPIDLQANLGVDVNDLNEQMSQVLAEIEKVGQTGGLITSPNTYAEFYHNARLLQQRGEVDLAMLNYEQAIASDIVFVDPIEDVIDLAIARYGKNYAKYIEKQILPKIRNANARQYIEWKLAPDFDKITPNEIAFETIFPPILFQWLKQHQKLLEENVRTSDNNQKTDYTSLYLLLEGSRLALRYQQTGEVQKYYIDNFRVRSDIDVGLLTNLIEELNRAEYKLFTSVYEVGTGSKFFDYSLALEEECLDESWGILGADPWEAMGFFGILQIPTVLPSLRII